MEERGDIFVRYAQWRARMITKIYYEPCEDNPCEDKPCENDGPVYAPRPLKSPPELGVSLVPDAFSMVCIPLLEGGITLREFLVHNAQVWLIILLAIMSIIMDVVFIGPDQLIYLAAICCSSNIEKKPSVKQCALVIPQFLARLVRNVCLIIAAVVVIAVVQLFVNLLCLALGAVYITVCGIIGGLFTLCQKIWNAKRSDVHPDVFLKQTVQHAPQQVQPQDIENFV